jgi:AAA domain
VLGVGGGFGFGRPQRREPDPARLQDALTGARDAHMPAPDTQSGLRAGQAVAAWSVLTDGRLVSVIDAPAGSGKTRVLAEAVRIWAEAGLGQVIGITASQSARNTLAAGVPVSYNAAQFLGLPSELPSGALRCPNSRSYGWRSTSWSCSNPSAFAPRPPTGRAALRRSRWPGCNSRQRLWQGHGQPASRCSRGRILAQGRDNRH